LCERNYDFKLKKYSVSADGANCETNSEARKRNFTFFLQITYLRHAGRSTQRSAVASCNRQKKTRRHGVHCFLFSCLPAIRL